MLLFLQCRYTFFEINGFFCNRGNLIPLEMIRDTIWPVIFVFWIQRMPNFEPIRIVISRSILFFCTFLHSLFPIIFPPKSRCENEKSQTKTISED